MRARVWFSAAALVAAVVVGAGVAAFIWWPSVHLGAPGDALAQVAAPRFAGQVTAVQVRSANGDAVPVELRDGRVTPRGTVGSGERLTIELTVRRPGWAAWLVGRTDHPTFTVETPSAHLLGRWLQIKSGGQVTIAFDKAVSVVSLAGKPPRRLDQPQRAVPIGLVASGTHLTGAVDVAVAARTWERPSAPVRVNWFPARPYPIPRLPRPRGSSRSGTRPCWRTPGEPGSCRSATGRPSSTPRPPTRCTRSWSTERWPGPGSTRRDGSG